MLIAGFVLFATLWYAARAPAVARRPLIDQPEHAAALRRAGYAKASSRDTWDAVAHRVRDLCQTVSAAHDGGARG